MTGHAGDRAGAAVTALRLLAAAWVLAVILAAVVWAVAMPKGVA